MDDIPTIRCRHIAAAAILDNAVELEKAEDGRYFAISMGRPMFCFEGESFHECLGKAERAMEFYERYLEKP